MIQNKLRNTRILVILRGVIAILFGLMALAYPRITVLIMAIGFGFFTLIGGIFLIIASLQRRKHTKYWGYWLFEGIIDAIIGLIILLDPRISVTVLLVIMGFWAVTGGLILMWLSFKMRNQQDQRSQGVLFLSILFLLFGAVLFLNPFGSALSFTIITGIFALIYGVVSLINAGKFHLISS